MNYPPLKWSPWLAMYLYIIERKRVFQRATSYSFVVLSTLDGIKSLTNTLIFGKSGMELNPMSKPDVDKQKDLFGHEFPN